MAGLTQAYPNKSSTNSSIISTTIWADAKFSNTLNSTVKVPFKTMYYVCGVGEL